MDEDNRRKKHQKYPFAKQKALNFCLENDHNGNLIKEALAVIGTTTGISLINKVIGLNEKIHMFSLMKSVGIKKRKVG